MNIMKKIPVDFKITGYLKEIQNTLSKEEFEEKLPKYSSDGNAAFDLRVAIEKPLELEANQSVLVGTGLALWIRDPNYVGLIVPRSGLGSKGIVVGNLVGVIDSNYQGELKISVWNRSKEKVVIQPWDRIAQYLLMPVYHGEFNLVEDFENNTDRGDKGFNSSGVK